MNNRIMAALFALTLCLCLFIGVVPVDAEAAETCTHSQKVYVGATTATCTKDGYGAHFECTACRAWFYNDTTKDVMTEAGKNAIKTPAKGHNWITDANTRDAENHWEGCPCGAKQNVTAHTPGEWLEENGKHLKRCTGCNYPLFEADHKQVTLDNKDEKTHRDECETCGKVLAAANAHVLKTVDNKDGTHTINCEYCDYKVENVKHADEDGTCKCDVCYAEMHQYTAYEKVGDTQHMRECKVCTKDDPTAKPEDHTFTNFKYVGAHNGTNYHSAVCSVCAYESPADKLLACVDKDGNHKCDDCGETMSHAYDGDYMEVILAPTVKDCTQKQAKFAYKKCKICGLLMLNSKVVTEDDIFTTPNASHTYVWEKNQGATHHQWCTVCKKETEKVAHEFVFVEGDGCVCECGRFLQHDNTNMAGTGVAQVDATCTKDGTKAHWLCPYCNQYLVRKEGSTTLMSVVDAEDLVIPATNHSWVQTSVTNSGNHIVECQVCKIVESFAHDDTNNDCLCDVLVNGVKCGLPVHSHSEIWVEGKAATCSAEGYEGYWKYEACGRMFRKALGVLDEIDAPIAIAKLDHTPGDWEKKDADTHAHFCEVCDEQVGDAAAHVDGDKDNYCDDCKAPINLVPVAGKAANCTDKGYKACWKNPLTNIMYADELGTQRIDKQEEIAPLGHDWTAWENIGTMHKHTCQRTGCTASQQFAHDYSSGCFCTACGLANGTHTATTYDRVEATCDKDGHLAYVKCSCGKYYNTLGEATTYQDLVLKATGHSWGAKLYNDDSAAKHYAVCANCGGKNYGEHKLTVKDPLSGNYHQMICECGEVTLEAHYDKNGDNVCDDTGCKRDLSNKTVEVNNNPSTTVVTGDKENTNSAWSWLKNWLTNTIPSNGGGSATPEQPADPNGAGTGSQSGSGSQNGSNQNGTNQNGSNQNGSNQNGSNQNGSNQNGSNQNGSGDQTTDATGVLQYIISFFNWVFSGFSS